MASSEPERTCVGCRRRAPRGELVRIAGSPSGVGVDGRSNLPGRGAYVHRQAPCVDAALRGGALARALRRSIGPEEASNLLRELRGVIEQA